MMLKVALVVCLVAVFAEAKNGRGGLRNKPDDVLSQINDLLEQIA